MFRICNILIPLIPPRAQFFPDWIPNSISSSICSVPHGTQGDSVTFVSNTTSMHEVFDRIIGSWDNMYKARSYLHVFEQDGISTQDMMESRNILRYVSDQYQEFARWEDKFFDGNTGPGRGEGGEFRFCGLNVDCPARRLVNLGDYWRLGFSGRWGSGGCCVDCGLRAAKGDDITRSGPRWRRAPRGPQPARCTRIYHGTQAGVNLSGEEQWGDRIKTAAAHVQWILSRRSISSAG